MREKTKELGTKHGYWEGNPLSQFPIIFLYKQTLNPVMTYGIQPCLLGNIEFLGNLETMTSIFTWKWQQHSRGRNLSRS